MSAEQKLYRIEGKLYRAEPASTQYSCQGCAFDNDFIGCGQFYCHHEDVIAKEIPASLPVPESVTIVDRREYN